jgi:gamma-glutamyl:cysteine ligase YbdK (ATP-grasp superfamily)
LIRLDEGKKVLRLPDWFLHENKWRAARYGHDAVLITDADGTEKDLKTIVDELVIELEPIAEKLGNLEELHSLSEFVRRDFAYERQLKIANKLIPNFGQSMFVDDIITENAGKAVVDHLIKELNAGKAIEV